MIYPPLPKEKLKMAVRYWLMKTEPTTYSIDDLVKDRDQTTCWEGVRNYQARNLLRDDVQQGDRVLFYHSACKEPAVVGTAIVSRDGYPDSHAFDRRSKYFDKKSDPENPTWYMVDIKLEKIFDEPVTLADLRQRASLKEMVLLQKGSRLSVQPVKKKEFDTVLKMASA
jgi:predicted RNA-binding protein with PUA-like domain